MENCPFCRKSISKNSDSCPHCKRVVIERVHIYSSSQTHKQTRTASHNIIPQFWSDFKKNFKHIADKLTQIVLNAFKKYVWLIILILLIIVGSLNKGGTSINSGPVSVLPNTEGITITPEITTKDPKDYVSLPNGTVLSKNSYYFDGLGQLKIDNGTSSDAIAKLVNIITNKSVVTLYVKANSVITISDISNGNYKLFFNLGNDWNAEVKAFTVNSGYEVFEEPFNFTTSEYTDSTRYAVFNVTLNPVVNGKARTNEINAKEFGGY